MGEEAFIARTQVVQSRFTIRRMQNAIFRASAMAHIPHLACLTIAGKRIQFGLPECSLGRTLYQLDKWSLLDISQEIFRVDKVVTREEVSVVFDDRNIPTGFSEDTQCMLLAKGCSGRFLEYLHVDPPDILPHPLVEDGGEKSAKSFSRHSAAADAAHGVRLGLDQGQKPSVLGPDLLEEPVNPGGVLNVVCMHNAQYIERDSVLLQEFIPTHRLFMGGIPAFGDAVPIVHFLRTVKANPYGKALCRQKAAPVLIEEGTVGLHTVGDAPVRGTMLALQRHNLAKVVQPQYGRFPAMPGKVDHRTGESVDVLDDVLLQDVVGHVKRFALWIEMFLLQVVTIVTAQVADGASRFYKNLKFTGCFDHCPIPNLRVERHKALVLL